MSATPDLGFGIKPRWPQTETSSSSAMRISISGVYPYTRFRTCPVNSVRKPAFSSTCLTMAQCVAKSRCAVSAPLSAVSRTQVPAVEALHGDEQPTDATVLVQERVYPLELRVNQAGPDQ